MTLCQIAVTKDIQKELAMISTGYISGLGGWGRFTGDVPPIGATFTIHYPEAHFRISATFRVEHQRWFFDETYLGHGDFPSDILTTGTVQLEVCVLICTVLAEHNK